MGRPKKVVDETAAVEVKEEKVAKKKKAPKTDVGGKVIHIRLDFISPILGSAPSDKEIYSTYVASKAPVKVVEKMEDEVDTLEATDIEVDQKVTIFHKSKTGTPFMYDYMIKGFCKNACHACREIVGTHSEKLTAYKGKIDNLIFPVQRYIKFEGVKEILFLQRPLRAQTPQGPRVALSSSEMIEPGISVNFDLEIKDANLYPYVIEWLEYGRVNGLGQWHNGGYGRFLYTEFADNGEVISTNASDKDRLIEEYYEFEGM